MNPTSKNTSESTDQNKQSEAEKLDVKLEGDDRGTPTMRQRKRIKNTDDASSINDDPALDQNSDPLLAKKQ